MRADVNSLMSGELGEWLASQAEMRASAREQAASRWTWGAALLMPVFAFVWFAPWFDGWRLMVFAIGAIAVATWGYQPIDKARKAIKVGINGAIARSLGIAYEHDVEPGGEFAA